MYKIFDKNTKGIDYAVGDIHGNYTALEKLLKKVGFNKSTDRLFSVGDLTDRGPESIRALEFLKYPWFIAVRGNHEQIIINHGLQDYDICYPKDRVNRDGNQWFFKLENSVRNNIIQEFSKLPYAIQVGNVGIVHAYPLADWKATLKCIKNKNRILMNNLIWDRTVAKQIEMGRYHFPPISGIDKVIVGHSIMRDVTYSSNVIFLDTGFFAGGMLSLLDLETFDVVAQVSDLN